MKISLFLAGILLPALSYAQSTGGVTTFQPTVDIGIPLYQDLTAAHPVILKVGVRYEGLYLADQKNIGAASFHSFTLPFLLSYSLSHTTDLSVLGAATVSSDLKGSIGGDDILYMAGVRIGFRPSKSLRYGVTLTYISNFSGKYLIPVPDIEWAITNRWSLTAILPARASLKYRLNHAQSIGLTTGFSGGTYLMNDVIKKQYLHLQQVSGGLVYDLTVARRLKLNVVAGHTFLQRLETFDMNQKISLDQFSKLGNRVPNVSYRQNAFVFQGGISYSF